MESGYCWLQAVYPVRAGRQTARDGDVSHTMEIVLTTSSTSLRRKIDAGAGFPCWSPDYEVILLRTRECARQAIGSDQSSLRMVLSFLGPTPGCTGLAFGPNIFQSRILPPAGSRSYAAAAPPYYGGLSKE